MKVTVILDGGGAMHCREFDVQGDLTVREAITQAGFAHLVPAGAGFGIWGKATQPDALLRDGDRVEIYRPLVADPKVARRKRAARRP